MLKPLLHTIPSLSGNVTLACNLTDYLKIGENIECHVRSARLVPLNSDLSIKKCEVSLLQSSYEFDIKKFYSYYPNHFYDSTFKFENKDYAEYSGLESLRYRDKDFEFGVKRVSYISNHNMTYTFFAPLWVESEDDMPDYFLMNIKIDSPSYDVEKTVKVIIKDYDSSYRYNYLYIYLSKYLKQIDSNVIYCRPFENKATYYGISLTRGGFARIDDSVIGRNYYVQSSINKFDENIANGFRRSKLCIKQVMPLSFYFDLDDFFTEDEKKRFKEARVYISGTWWKNGKELPFYDFSTDYNYFTQKVWNFKTDGVFDYIDSKKNIMNVDYPSLNEANLQEYKYFNTLPKNVTRWKLKYSDDSDPYITNLSFAFSFNQGSPNKYKEYPSIYAISNGFSNKYNNLVLPKGRALTEKESLYSRDERTLTRYRKAMLANASNWFNVVDETEWYEKFSVNTKGQFNDKRGEWYELDLTGESIDVTYSDELKGIEQERINSVPLVNIEDFNTTNIKKYVKLSEERNIEIAGEYDPDENQHDLLLDGHHDLYIKHTIFDDENNWANVDKGKVYFKGILYDLTKLLKENIDIDKFGVFVKPTLNKLDIGSLKNIKTAKWTVMTGDKNIHKANAFLSPYIKSMLTGKHLDEIPSLFINEIGVGKQMNEVTHDSLFIKNESQTEDGEFISLTELKYNINKINRYYKVSEVEKLDSIYISYIEPVRNKYVIDGFELLPIYRLSQVLDGNDFMFSKHKMSSAKWIYESMYFSTRENHTKVKYDKNTLRELLKKKPNEKYETQIYLKDSFISAYNLSYLTNIDNSSLDGFLYEYSFNPIIVDSNEVIAENVFEKRNIYHNYGDVQILYHKNDKDFIWVLNYNLKNALGPDIYEEMINYDVVETLLKCKIINHEHLKVYLSELYKNENREASYPNDSPANRVHIKLRVLYNNGIDVYLKDEFISLNDIFFEIGMLSQEGRVTETLSMFESCGDGCWKFSKEFYSKHDIKHLIESTGMIINIPDYSEFKFELVYNAEFVKLNSFIWDKINIENGKEYRDFYLYKLSKEQNYPRQLIYYYAETNKGFSIDNNNTSMTVEPLFNDIWMQDRDATIIYSEYNQSKISEVTFYRYSTLYEPSDIKLYKYDCDNTLLMYDLSDFDIAHSYFTYNNYRRGTWYPTFYISYSYINNAYLSYENDPLNYNEDTIEYKIVHGTLFENPNYKYLPTYKKLDEGKSEIALAKGYEPLLEYYSTYSYNTVVTDTYSYISYYSEESHSRIDFQSLGELLTLTHVDPQQYNYSDSGISYYMTTQTTMFDSLFTYHDIHARYIQNPIEYDDLGLYDKYKVSTYVVEYEDVIPNSYIEERITENMIDETGSLSTSSIEYVQGIKYEKVKKASTYAMLWIESEFNNTNSSFNLVDIYGNDKKYFTYINNMYIYDDNFKVSDYFKDIVPFSKIYLRDALKDSGFAVKPSMFNFTNYWRSITDYDGLMRAYFFNKPIGSTTLERYFDSITPFIPETSTVSTYSTKYKSTRTTLMKSTDESLLYKSNPSIWKYEAPRIYESEKEFVTLEELERKHFNDNTFINLEKEIIIDFGENLLYEEVIAKEEYENVLAEFANHIRRYLEVDDSGILFLYNKYNIKYDSQCMGIDYERINKIYSLKLKFTLK